MREWNPSYDFRLFDIGWASPLQVNEFGAATSFRATDPTAFVDYSLNQLAGLLNPRAANPFAQRQLPAPIEDVPFVPLFQGRSQSRAEIEAEVARREAEFKRAEGEYRRAGSAAQAPANPTMRKACSATDLFWGRCRFENGVLVGTQTSGSGGEPIGDGKAPAGMAAVEAWLNALPSGAGIFLIGLAALIFIFLFVRR